MPLRATPAIIEASTRGTTIRWIGSMPRVTRASISSRIFREPRSAQIAVAPAPATTSTLTIGPISRTTATAAPAPARSIAPIWISSWLTWKMITTQNGIDTRIAGQKETVVMNHACEIISRNWSRRVNICLKVLPAKP